MYDNKRIVGGLTSSYMVIYQPCFPWCIILNFYTRLLILTYTYTRILAGNCSNECTFSFSMKLQWIIVIRRPKPTSSDHWWSLQPLSIAWHSSWSPVDRLWSATFLRGLWKTYDSTKGMCLIILNSRGIATDGCVRSRTYSTPYTDPGLWYLLCFDCDSDPGQNSHIEALERRTAMTWLIVIPNETTDDTTGALAQSNLQGSRQVSESGITYRQALRIQWRF